jgi:DNA-binding response OmpR family regulator
VRVLVVEDSARLQASLTQGLREAGFAVDAVGDGKRALIHGRTTDYDVIVLDLMLPGMDGLSVLRELRRKLVRSCVLILTARDSVDDRVLGLRSGADDYLVKPFAFRELLARVRALVRRTHGATGSCIRVGPLEVDSAARTARVTGGAGGGAGGRDFPLPPREFALLEYLAHRAGRPVTRPELEEHLYGEGSPVRSNAVDVAVSSLRARLAAAGCPPLIRTRWRVGYVMGEAP